MKRLLLYMFCLLWVNEACTREDKWVARPATAPGLRKVSLELAVNGNSVFEEYVHSLAIYAFLQTNSEAYRYYKKVVDLTEEDIKRLEAGTSVDFNTSDSKILKLILPEGVYEFYVVANDLTGGFVEPDPGGTVNQGYLPYPAGGVKQPYFMGNVVLKPGISGAIPIYVILTRVVSRLTVVLSDIPADIDTVRYRVSDMASRVLLTGALAGDTVSMTGVYTRERMNVAATADTVISRLLLFPALKTNAVLQLTFSSGSTVVREKSVVISNLKPDSDVYIPGRWDTSFTTRVPTSSIPFYNNYHSGD